MSAGAINNFISHSNTVPADLRAYIGHLSVCQGQPLCNPNRQGRGAFLCCGAAYTLAQVDVGL